MSLLRKVRGVRPGLALLILAGALFVAGVFWGVSQISRFKRSPQDIEAERAAKAAKEAQEKSVDIQGATIQQRDAAGNLLWSLKAAGKLTVDEQGRAVTGERVHWELARASQQLLVLDAPRFAGNYGAGRLNFTGGVSATTDNGRTAFSAPNMVFDIGTRTIAAEGPVSLRRAPYQCSAKRLVFDDAHGEIRLTQGVEARDDERQMTFAARDITIALDKERLAGTGGIRFHKGPYSATAGRLLVDNQAKRLKLTGGVRFAYRP